MLVTAPPLAPASSLSFFDLLSCPDPLPAHAADLFDLGGFPVSALDFYGSIFRDYLAPSCAPADYRSGDYSGIALEIVQGDRRRAFRKTVTRELVELFDLIDNSPNFCLVSPVSYAGRRRTNTNSRFLFALTIEIDNLVPSSGLRELYYSFTRDTAPLPLPTYIVCSGSGLHLYYVFASPIPLYPPVFAALSDVKKYFTARLWTKFITNSYSKIQFQSLNQAFRCVGSFCKDSKSRVLAFQVGDLVTLDYLNRFLPPELKVLSVFPKGKISLDQAKKLYPDWYRRRILLGQPRGHFSRNRAIYDNWIDKILKYAVVGHRYYCLENLCALAVQCEISPPEIENDCQKVAAYFDTLTVDPKNSFTVDDVLSALNSYYYPTDGVWRRKIDYISLKTGINLVRNKRNFRPRDQHIKIASAVRDVLYPGGSWRYHGGAPVKQQVVLDWRKKFPTGSKTDCRADTGLSRPTIAKWWDSGDS